MLQNDWQIIEAGGITSALGFQAAGVACKIKKQNKDLALIYSEVPALAAGVFTTNKVKAAPVLISQKHLVEGTIQGIVVNSGNANACTGQKGLEDAQKMTQLAAEALKLKGEQVLVSSTGVIGFPLPMEKVAEGIKAAAQELTPAGGLAAAEAIMTTDTFPKQLAVSLEIGGKKVTIGGIAKGSGMIHPNMATMLGFVTTDAAIAKEDLYTMLKTAIDQSFNMITVDGDTSTNDMVVILANGLADNPTSKLGTPEGEKFQAALNFLTACLAKDVVKDGEGATKIVEIKVENALTQEDAQKAAMAVATSSLVKTAIFGEDANWGRIICAVGYSGAEINPEKIDISLASAAGAEMMAQDGQGLAFDEAKAKRILEEKEITILIDLQIGTEKAVAWTCDFSYDYVKINASYRS